MQTQEKVQARKLKGFQDYHPNTMRSRFRLMDIVRQEASKAGFNPIGTPALEYAQVLLGLGGETDKQLFRFLDNGERDIALRFDLTVPFARYVAEHQGQLIFPFKRLQIGDVWRAEKPQKGRFREFCQCDLDIVGVNSLEADAEILLCFQNILHAFDCGAFTMSVGHRVLLSALIRNTLGVLPEAVEQQALIIIDKLDKLDGATVTAMLAGLEGASPQGAGQLVQALQAKTKEGSSLEAISPLIAQDKEALSTLATLRELVELVSHLCQSQRGKIVIDLSIARGLGYYTGIVFETRLDALPGLGAICSGGRYNQLVERYLDRELPGIGGSIGLDRLLVGLEELGSLPAGLEVKPIFIAVATPDARTYAFELVHLLRTNGIATDITLKPQKLANQFKHANRLGYPYVLTVGSEEASQKTVACKDMQTGLEEKGLSIDNLVSRLTSKEGSRETAQLVP